MLHVHDVAFYEHGGEFDGLRHLPCIANSHFTAEKYRSAYGVNATVIYPFVVQERYKTDTTRENITFINPHPEKGRDIAIKIARLCPEIPFTFVEGWRLSDQHRRELADQLAALPKVTFLPSHNDMRKIYGKCKILLAPSVVEEAFGRVATEAHVNGIPVVASSRGGLPEAVGPGGILLDPESPIDDWVYALRRLWQDNEVYAHLSAAAVAHAQRLEMSFAYQIDAHEKAMLAACGGNHRAEATI
jgi:glycosyltransferase involved in cell wall biosynthesis